MPRRCAEIQLTYTPLLTDLFKEDDANLYATVDAHLDNGQDPNSAMARLLMNAGADLLDFGPSVIRDFTGASLLPKQHVSKEAFDKQKHRIFGTQNPESVEFEFWREAIRERTGGYLARDQYGISDTDPHPIWSFERSGMSTTALPDGRWVQTASEHEDHYDPDFCIYSDVFVFDGNGGLVIFIYPRDVFPPTDFHSATLVGDEIILIGNLGYPEDRQPGVTQVLSLSTKDFSISRVHTSGAMPGWISTHRSILKNGQIIVSGGQVWTGTDLIENERRYQLSVNTGEWTEL